MFHHAVDESTSLRSIESLSPQSLFEVINANREHVGLWHPWANSLLTVQDTERLLANWQTRNTSRQSWFNGVWHEERLVGMANFVFFDWANHWGALSYWLDQGHQGRGIMTRCCRVLMSQGFDGLRLNRITIECATENLRSRALPERLGFRAEGVLREVECLGGRHVDHAVYGMLRSEWRS